MIDEIITIDGITIKIERLSESDIQELNESKTKGKQLIGNYSYDIHQPHNSTGEYHLNLYEKGKKILSMNKKSGSAHDGYHGTRIPNKAFKELKNKFSDWEWPESQIIESLNYTYFIDNGFDKLRPVKVLRHRDFELRNIDDYFGFFHQFAEDPFLTGGTGGWKERTVALIEDESGYIRKVPVDCFKYLDID